jgi:hypothetical protein
MGSPDLACEEGECVKPVAAGELAVDVSDRDGTGQGSVARNLLYPAISISLIV